MKKLFLTLYILSLFTSLISYNVPAVNAAESCTVSSAQWNPSGDQAEGWFKEGKTHADITITTTGCLNQMIEFSIIEADTCFVANCDDRLSDSRLDGKEIRVTDGTLTLNILLGEEECDSGLGGYNCHLFIYIQKDGNTLYNSWHEKNGDLFYYCDGKCFADAEVSEIVKKTADTPVGIEAKKNIQNKTAYTLLAPIGDLKCVDTNVSNPAPGCEKGGIGDYLNIIFKIAIGLAGALAVILIIIHSIQYMGDESVFGKTEAKSKILSAIFGLLIALGAYALLNTISPDLTGVNGVVIDQVKAQLDEEGIMVSSDAPAAPSGDLTTWARQYGKKLKMTLKNGQIIEITPCDTSQMVWFNNTFGTSFQLNKHLYNTVDRLYSEWKKNYINYKMVSAGGYVCKLIVGQDGKPTKYLSFHSYGLAVDFNASTNGRGTKGNMPPNFVNVWKQEGWSWGGDWKWTDPMHFGMGEKGNNIKGE